MMQNTVGGTGGKLLGPKDNGKNDTPAKPSVINPLVTGAIAQPAQPSGPADLITGSLAGAVAQGEAAKASGGAHPIPIGGAVSVNHGIDPTLAAPGNTTTAAAPAKTPEQRAAEDAAAGYAHADQYGIGKEGSMGRLYDERKTEMDDLLAKQKAGLDGMTQAEMQAAKEQGTSTINQQLATNMQQFGDVAAGNGIRGGAAAGLQMQALAGAQNASGQLARQMILDNVAQKNVAMDRYGNTLTGQQAVGLGIQDKNNQSKNAETLARELAAGNYASTIDSGRASDKADSFTERGLDLSQQTLDDLKAERAAAKSNPGGSGEGVNAIDAADTHKVNALSKTEQEKTAALKAWNDGTHGMAENAQAGRDMKDLAASIKERVALQYPGESEQTKKELVYKELLKTGMSEQYARKMMKIICTEAFHQGLISEEQWLVTQRYRMLLTMREYKGYLTWATPVVARMRRNPEFAKAIAPYIRRMIEGERHALGEIDSLTVGEHTVATLVKIANYSAYAFRVLRFKAQSVFAVRAHA